MGKAHVPFGYRIIGGKAVIEETEAEQIRKIYEGYLSGLSYTGAAADAGLTMTHSSVKNLIRNTRYTGDGYYPAVIDRETFDAAETERLRRVKLRGRDYPRKPARGAVPVQMKFRLKKPRRNKKDPYEQAAFIYSLIESEE